MQTQIYLIRHGEVHNPDGIIYGRLPNFGLSEKGKREVEKTAEFLQDKHIDMLYTSPLERAKQSAAIIRNKLHLSTIHIAPEISETLSSYQGHKFNELDAFQSEVFLKPLSPMDETIEQLATRMEDFIMNLCKQHPGEHIAAVSHGDPIMALKAEIENKPLDISFKMSNYIQHAEVYKITYDENKLTLDVVFKPVIQT